MGDVLIYLHYHFLARLTTQFHVVRDLLVICYFRKLEINWRNQSISFHNVLNFFSLRHFISANLQRLFVSILNIIFVSRELIDGCNPILHIQILLIEQLCLKTVIDIQVVLLTQHLISVNLVLGTAFHAKCELGMRLCPSVIGLLF